MDAVPFAKWIVVVRRWLPVNAECPSKKSATALHGSFFCHVSLAVTSRALQLQRSSEKSLRADRIKQPKKRLLLN